MSNVSEILQWFANMPKNAWPVLAAIAAGSGLVIWLGSELPSHIVVIAWAGMQAFFLLVFRLVQTAVEVCKGRVRKFSQLSDQQQAFLSDQYGKGHRRFTLRESSNPRWIEELEEWNYVEMRESGSAMGHPWIKFDVTTQGWRELEKLQSKPRRSTIR